MGDVSIWENKIDFEKICFYFFYFSMVLGVISADKSENVGARGQTWRYQVISEVLGWKTEPNVNKWNNLEKLGILNVKIPKKISK